MTLLVVPRRDLAGACDALQPRPCECTAGSSTIGMLLVCT